MTPTLNELLDAHELPPSEQHNTDDLYLLIKIYSTPREKYNENFYTKGQGGIGGNSNFAGSGG